MNNDHWDIRRDYLSKPLNEASMFENPFDQFDFWLDEVKETAILDPLAATLATVGHDNIPSARILLIKEIHDDGFVFYTGYDSEKASQLSQNPNGCLNIYWDILHRQIRITGTLTHVSRDHTEAYFHSRPFESQIAAYISRQSETIPNRQLLEDRFHTAYQTYKGKTIPLPEHWGGYKLTAHTFEFWQGLPSRMHDRIVYKKNLHATEQTWIKQRKSP